MTPTKLSDILIADRIWIATALLHRQFPNRLDFAKDEIRSKLDEEALSDGVERGSINAHLKEHCVSNVPPSSGKYRMLFEDPPGRLRLFKPGDLTHPARIQRRKPSKSVPQRDEIPEKYWPLLDWYARWSSAPSSLPPTKSGSGSPSAIATSWKDDPLIRLIGSGKHIWADEHADEYVENLRREDV